MRNWRLIRLTGMIVTLAWIAGWGAKVSAAPAASIGVNDAGQAQATSHIYLPIVSKPALNPVRNPGFEAGRDGSWDENSSVGYELVLFKSNLAVTPHGGSWAAWLGGADNETSILTQTDIPLAGVRYLHYWYWIASFEVSCSNDYAAVSVNGNQVAHYDLCSGNEAYEWKEEILDLNGYGGEIISLEFEVATNVSENSNFFLDDVSITNSASPSTGAPLRALPLTGAERRSKAGFK